MQDFRCEKCNKLLLKDKLREEVISALKAMGIESPFLETKCPRCGTMNKK